MITFRRTADLYYDEQGNLVACVSRRIEPCDPADVFIPNGAGLQELLNELVPGITIKNLDDRVSNQGPLN